MKAVISASRRTDLLAFFPGWLAAALREKQARVVGPSGRVQQIGLAPESIHTVVIWSKDFSNLLRNSDGLKDLLGAFDQVYCHFTLTGLGGTTAEPETPRPEAALAQVPALVEFAGNPRRVSLRFDPVVFWRDGVSVRSNLAFFGRIADAAAASGVEDIRMSFAQWYRKSRKRALSRNFLYLDPSEEEKLGHAAVLAAMAQERGLTLFACCQPFLTDVAGILPSACIDGRRLQELHPRREPVSLKKDRTQRKSCFCTESKDIGSYTQSCPHGCVYCYASPSA